MYSAVFNMPLCNIDVCLRLAGVDTCFYIISMYVFDLLVSIHVIYNICAFLADEASTHVCF